MDDGIGRTEVIAGAQNRQAGDPRRTVDHEVKHIERTAEAAARAVARVRGGCGVSRDLIERDDGNLPSQQFLKQGVGRGMGDAAAAEARVLLAERRKPPASYSRASNSAIVIRGPLANSSWMALIRAMRSSKS